MKIINPGNNVISTTQQRGNCPQRETSIEALLSPNTPNVPAHSLRFRNTSSSSSSSRSHRTACSCSYCRSSTLTSHTHTPASPPAPPPWPSTPSPPLHHTHNPTSLNNTYAPTRNRRKHLLEYSVLNTPTMRREPRCRRRRSWRVSVRVAHACAAGWKRKRRRWIVAVGHRHAHGECAAVGRWAVRTS